MNAKELILKWFDCWEKGEIENLPVSDEFEHHSPFGVIKGKQEYLNLIEKNKDKFLGYRFEVHELIFEEQRACSRYSAIQNDFRLDVSEWYEIVDRTILRIRAYYHIGEIRDDRKLEDQ